VVGDLKNISYIIADEEFYALAEYIYEYVVRLDI